MKKNITRDRLIADLQSAEERIAELERALRENPKNYRLLVDTANEGIWSMDSGHRTTYVNQSMADMLGYSPSEMIGKPVEEFFFPEDMEFHNQRMEQRHAGQDEIYERRFKRRDGSALWTMVSAKVIKDEQGNFNGSFAMFTDITERKQANEALHFHNQLLSAVVDIEHSLAASLDREVVYENLKNGIQRIFPDVATIFISSFDAERKMIKAVYGCQDGNTVDVASLPELPLAPEGGGGNQSQVIHSRQPLVIDSDLEKKFRSSTVIRIGHDGGAVTQSALYVPMLAQEKVLGVIQLQSYSPNRFTEGDVRALTLIANTTAVSIQNANLYSLAQEEISERRQTEETLRESENRFSTIFQHSPLGIVITRLRDNTLLEINPAWLQLLGYAREEVIGHTALELGIWEASQDRENMVANLLSRDHVAYFESVFRKKSGEKMSALVSAEAVTLGYEPCMLTQFIDITERKKSENALAASEKKLKSLIDSQTHFVLRIDFEGRYTYWNAKFEREFGWIHHPRGIQNASAMDTICEYHRPRVISVVERCIAAPGKAFSVEIDKPAQGGGVRTTLWEFMCLTDERNRPSEIQCMGIEITDRKKAEEDLRESEEKYRGLMESLDSAICTVDYDGTFLYMNSVAARQLGGLAGDFIGKNMLELFPEPIGSRQLEEVQKIISEDAAAVFEAPSLGIGGLRWYRFSIQPLHAENGKPTHALINITDIHQFKSIQYELEELNRTLEKRVKARTAEVQDLYDNAPTGYHSLDAEGRAVMINQTELNWLGYERDEVIGHSMMEFLSPASRSAFDENYSLLKKRGWIKDVEYEMIRKDGSALPVIVNGTAIRDEQGNYLMSRSTVFDNTERKKAENALRESEKQTRLLFELMPDAVILFDAAGRAVQMNHAFELLTGISAAQFLGHTMDEMGLLSREQVQRLSASTLKGLQLNGNFAATDFKLRRVDGEIRDLGARIFALEIEGNPHFLTTMRDITFEKKIEESLRIANAEMERALRMKDEFLANMSHELRTPLNAILGLSESLLEQTIGLLNNKQQKYLNTISESGHHLLNLINDILDLAKVEAGQITLDMLPLDVKTVCESSLRMVNQLAHKKKQTVELDIEDGVGLLQADERRLKQMIVNLLSNAVKFTPEGGRVGVKVSVDREDAMLLITVWDTGIGIAEKDIERLFQPFVQLDAGLARESSGTGLGLALVAQMARLHGGSVSVSSEVGRGSRFIIILPWKPVSAVEPNGRAAANEPISKPVQIESSKTILLVDDTESVLMLYRDYLKRQGYRVEVATDGIECVNKAIELHPDLILMDVMMPAMNGMEAAKRIRGEESLRRIPIIALTALAMPSDRQRCLDAGMNDYMSKPIGLQELLALVEKYLNGLPDKEEA